VPPAYLPLLLFACNFIRSYTFPTTRRTSFSPTTISPTAPCHKFNCFRKKKREMFHFFLSNKKQKGTQGQHFGSFYLFAPTVTQPGTFVWKPWNPQKVGFYLSSIGKKNKQTKVLRYRKELSMAFSILVAWRIDILEEADDYHCCSVCFPLARRRRLLKVQWTSY